MAKTSVITLPNGTKIEVSPDLTPEQITAMIQAVTASTPMTPVASTPQEDEAGDVIIRERTVDEIWNSSKREQVALFVRTFIAPNHWFSAKDIVDLQISELGRLSLGETSAIGTYLQRLHESGYLDKEKIKNSRGVTYKTTSDLEKDYPAVAIEQFKILIDQ